MQRIVDGKITDERGRQIGHVPRRRIVTSLRQTRGIDEVGIRHTQLPSILIHQIGESGLISSNELSQRDTRIVSRLNDDALEQILDGHLLSHLDEHFRAAHLPRLLADGNQIVYLELAVRELCQGHVHSHHLGETRRFHRLVGVDLNQHSAAVVILQDVSPGVDRRGRRFHYRGFHHQRGHHCGKTKCNDQYSSHAFRSNFLVSQYSPDARLIRLRFAASRGRDPLSAAPGDQPW